VDPSRVRPSYSLADQLFVDPHPLLEECFDAESWPVEMTDQEVAVALSHIAVWERIAASDSDYSLILEDDTCFRRGFCRDLDEAWSDLVWSRAERSAFDLLYVSYKEVKTGKRFVPISDSLFKPLGGLWCVWLLDALPVCGPVDAWINRRFEAMRVFATRRSIVQQRPDCPSSNLYSVLPVLSQVGVLTGEKPLLATPTAGSSPVFAIGDPGSGLTALAMALSILGYRCCSDLNDLPTSERNALFGRKRGRVFDAYVNIGALTSDHYTELARIYPGARFIITANPDRALSEWSSLADALRPSASVLTLKSQEPDVLHVDVVIPDHDDVLCRQALGANGREGLDRRSRVGCFDSLIAPHRHLPPSGSRSGGRRVRSRRLLDFRLEGLPGSSRPSRGPSVRLN
jgi:hypothetical protein